MDVMGELEMALKTSGFSRARLAALLREVVPEKEKAPRKKREPPPPTTIYTEVKRNYTCLHCGGTFSSTVRLTKEEDTAVVAPSGFVQVINSSSPAEVSCITSHCEHCNSFISQMPRSELEHRYKTLLGMVSLVGKADIFGIKNTIVMEEQICQPQQQCELPFTSTNMPLDARITTSNQSLSSSLGA